MARLRTVELYRDDQRKIIAIESVEFTHSKFNNGGQLYGTLVPLVVIVCDANGKLVLAVDADKTNLETLKQDHPELDKLIADACVMRGL
jgi:sensor domain CHASE-containing protein